MSAPTTVFGTIVAGRFTESGTTPVISALCVMEPGKSIKIEDARSQARIRIDLDRPCIDEVEEEYFAGHGFLRKGWSFDGQKQHRDPTKLLAVTRFRATLCDKSTYRIDAETLNEAWFWCQVKF